MNQSVFEQTDQELSQQIAKGNKSSIETQTLALLDILKQVGEAVQENKTVTVENTVRRVVGEVSVSRPDWIKELLPDMLPIQKKLDYIASAIIRKEVVRKMDFNRPNWLDEIKPKDIVFPESKEAEKINPILSEILKAIQEKEITEKVEVTNALEIKEPKWYKPLDWKEPVLKIASFLGELQKKLFKVEVQNEITIANPVSEVTVKNPQKEVKISNLKVLEENTALMTAQLRALGTTGGNAASSGATDTSLLATEETLVGLDSYPAGAGSNGTVTLTNATTAYSIPATASTKKHTLIVYNGSDTNMYIGYATLTIGGILLPAGGVMNFDLGANQGIFAYCGSAGKILNYSYKEIN